MLHTINGLTFLVVGHLMINLNSIISIRFGPGVKRYEHNTFFHWIDSKTDWRPGNRVFDIDFQVCICTKEIEPEQGSAYHYFSGAKAYGIMHGLGYNEETLKSFTNHVDKLKLVHLPKIENDLE